MTQRILQPSRKIIVGRHGGGGGEVWIWSFRLKTTVPGRESWKSPLYEAKFSIFVILLSHLSLALFYVASSITRAPFSTIVTRRRAGSYVNFAFSLPSTTPFKSVNKSTSPVINNIRQKTISDLLNSSPAWFKTILCAQRFLKQKPFLPNTIVLDQPATA